MSIYLRNFIRFVLLVLIQVLLLNKLSLNWWAPPYTAFVYPLFLLLLPVSTPTSYTLVFAFLIGIVIDAFMNTGGVHAFTCVLMALPRRRILSFFLPEKIEEYGNVTPGPKVMRWSSFLAYAAILMFLHNFIYILLETWSFKSILYSLTKTGVCFLTSMLFIIIYLLLFAKSINKRVLD